MFSLETTQSSILSEAHNINFIMQQLKTSVLLYKDHEADHLLQMMDQSVSQLVTYAGLVDKQAEIDLALQPLRAENVQLRR